MAVTILSGGLNVCRLTGWMLLMVAIRRWRTAMMQWSVSNSFISTVEFLAIRCETCTYVIMQPFHSYSPLSPPSTLCPAQLSLRNACRLQEWMLFFPSYGYLVNLVRFQFLFNWPVCGVVITGWLLIIPRLHDTTGCQTRFDSRVERTDVRSTGWLYTWCSRLSNQLSNGFYNRLNVCIHDTTGCIM